MKSYFSSRIFAMMLLGSAFFPAVVGADDNSAENSWKAPPAGSEAAAEGRLRPRRDHRDPPPMTANEADSDGMMSPDIPPPPPPRPRLSPEDEGMGNRDGVSPLKRFQRRLLDLRNESRRLRNGDQEIAHMREKTEALKTKGLLTPESEKRAIRMATLREELNGLEREEFVSRIKQETAKMAETLQERLDSVNQKAPPSVAEQMKKYVETAKTLNSASTDFETLAKAIDQVASELPSQEEGGGREERFRREIDVLRNRIDTLRQEYGNDGGENDGMTEDQPARRQNRQRPGIIGEDGSTLQGSKGLAPGALKKDSQAGEKKRKDSE